MSPEQTAELDEYEASSPAVIALSRKASVREKGRSTLPGARFAEEERFDVVANIQSSPADLP